MGAALAIGGGIQALSAGALAIGGNRRRKRAERELRKLIPPELSNPYANLRVSTLGADQASQNQSQQNANIIQAAQRGGVRAMASVTPQLTQSNIEQNRNIAANLDQQFVQNDRLEAQGAERIRNMHEARYNNTLAGLQAERSAGLQDTYTGLGQLGVTLGSMGSNFMGQNNPMNNNSGIQNTNNAINQGNVDYNLMDAYQVPPYQGEIQNPLNPLTIGNALSPFSVYKSSNIG